MFAEEADNLFLGEIDELSSKDFVGLLDFYDDYEQIRHILPLNKTTQKLRRLETDSLWEKALKKLEKNVQLDDNLKRKVDDYENYFDIEDKSIDNLFDSIKKPAVKTTRYSK